MIHYQHRPHHHCLLPPVLRIPLHSSDIISHCYVRTVAHTHAPLEVQHGRFVTRLPHRSTTTDWAQVGQTCSAPIHPHSSNIFHHPALRTQTCDWRTNTSPKGLQKNFSLPTGTRRGPCATRHTACACTLAFQTHALSPSWEQFNSSCRSSTCGNKIGCSQLRPNCPSNAHTTSPVQLAAGPPKQMHHTTPTYRPLMPDASTQHCPKQ